MLLGSVLVLAAGSIGRASANRQAQDGSRRKLAQPVPTLSTARAVRALLPEQAKLRYPVHLRAVCVVCFPGWHGFFSNDGSSGVYIEIKNQIPLTNRIRPGTYLDIVGVTGAGEYAPIVDQSDVRVLGERPLPPSRMASLDHLLTGVEDGQRIAFEGTVRSAASRDGMLDLRVASGHSQVEVMTLAGSSDIRRLIDARVKIEGTTGPVFNQRHQMVGTNVYTQTADSIRILQPAPSDPFSIPLRPVSRVFAYTPGFGPEDLVRIRGVVVARMGQTVFLSDGKQGASVLAGQTTLPAPGEIVDAVGYPALGDTSHILEDAAFRRLGTASLPEARQIGVAEALSGDFEGDLVRLSGRLVEVQNDAEQSTLLVDAAGSLFSAILPRDLNGKSLAGLREGSRVQLTGICVISETKASRHFRLPKAFQLLLRTSGDVTVLESPSWWTPRHATTVLTVGMMGTALVLAWVVALRKRVAQQTSLLRESEERFRHLAQHDTLTGLATRMVLQDRLKVALEWAGRQQSGVALLMLDLDKFKKINDTHGHHAGDQVLRVTAARLQDAVRKSDTVARLGGDEFVVLMGDLDDQSAAESIAEKVVAALSLPIPFAGHMLPISASVGVCVASGEMLDADLLLKNADLALYRAKAQGRNRYQAFTPQMAHANGA